MRIVSVSSLAAALLVAGLSAGCGAADDSASSESTASSEPSEETTPSEESTPVAEGPLELTVPENRTGRCMAPSVDNLTTQELAFEGTATEVADGSVTFSVGRWFKGEGPEEVVLGAPGEQLQMLLDATAFEEGERYLVSATDDQVSLCGLSGPLAPELEQLYDQAYPN